jgi:hypothetical protein
MEIPDQLDDWVEVNGFEPSTSAVRRQRSTGLSYTPQIEQRGRAQA